MAKGKAFDRQVAIAVEGIDFLHLMRTQFDCERTDTDFWLYDFFEDREDSRENSDAQVKGNKLTQWLANFRKQAQESHAFKPRTLALIRDAEDDSSAQFNSVCAALATAGLPIPGGNGQFATGAWERINEFRVGVLIIPHDRNTGCLETCLLRAPRLTHALRPAETFLDEVESAWRADPAERSRLEAKTEGGLARWREKVRVRSMIASSLDDPGQKLGNSGNWLWDFTAAPLKQMIDFIREACAGAGAH